MRTHDPVGALESFGSCTATLPDLRRGRIGLVCGTVMSRIDPNDLWTRTGMYTQAQCHGVGRGHLAYYQALERNGHIRFVRSVGDLDATVHDLPDHDAYLENLGVARLAALQTTGVGT